MMELHLDQAVDFISSRQAKLVALQFPEGLKVRALEVAEELERRTGCLCLILGDPCYGACDVSTGFRAVADALVHFGHTPIPSLPEGEDVLFIEVRLDRSIQQLLPALLPRLKRKVGLVSTPQHLHLLPETRAWIEEQGGEARIGRGDRRVKHPGQVLGCNVTAAEAVQGEVDQFLFIGSGDFHPLAVALATGKEVLVLDPLMGEVRDVEALKEKVLRQRHAAIALAQEAGCFGVVVSSKPGQRRRALALKLKELLEERGRRAVLVVLDNVTPEQLLPFQVDAFVSTACPRVAIDDALRYKRPMITPPELEIALGLRSWEDYAFDSILG